MADKFLASWKSLSKDDRKNLGIVGFTKQSEVDAPKKTVATTECPSIIYNEIEISSDIIYFYSYPTIHWTLEKVPEDDTYWIGLYKVGAKDTDYEVHQYLQGIAQGSYYAGEIKNEATLVSQNFSQEYELRIFKGEQRLHAKTNILHKYFNVTPTDPFADNALELLDDVKAVQLDQSTSDFAYAIANPKLVDVTQEQSCLDDSYKQWRSFKPQQQQLLLPILEQSFLPDEVRNPGPKKHDLADPIARFPNLGKSVSENPDRLNRIVLTITLNKSSFSFFPEVIVKEGIDKHNPWVGMQCIQSDLCFDPDTAIGRANVGIPYAGQTHTLQKTTELSEGPTNMQYLGVIYDDADQLGFSATTIQATISTHASFHPTTRRRDIVSTVGMTPTGPLWKYTIDNALLCANICSLSYNPYSVASQQLLDFGFTTRMEIHDAKTDTNGIIASNSNTTMVVFRGTSSFKDFITDIKFWKSPTIRGAENPYYASKGFVRSLDSVIDSIMSEINVDLGMKEIVLTGHSLGGALASLLSDRLAAEHHYTQSVLYVFGCPPMGDANFARSFNSRDSYVVTLEDDFVSNGMLLSIGASYGLYKPDGVIMLKGGHHVILDYIEALKELKQETYSASSLERPRCRCFS